MSDVNDDPMVDPLLSELSELPPLDVSPAAAERIRALAHAELARSVAIAPWRRAARRVYRRAELVAVAAMAASYLVFALRAALAPFH